MHHGTGGFRRYGGVAGARGLSAGANMSSIGILIEIDSCSSRRGGSKGGKTSD